MPPQDPESARWFAEHLQVHEPMLRAWLHSKFPQIADIDDIIQEAYVRVLAARTKREIRETKAFFFATARNLAYRYYHRNHLKVTVCFGEPDDTLLVDESVDIAETAAHNQELELMTQAIQSLPHRCRQIMTLRTVYGMAYKDIATRLGITAKTVEIQIGIGLRKCVDYGARFRDS